MSLGADGAADVTGGRVVSVSVSGCVGSSAPEGGASVTFAAVEGRAELRNAVLTDAMVSGADFGGARLWGADLSGANLTGASFAAADLTGASFVGALCARTDFAKAKGVASARFGHGTCSEYAGAAPRRAYIPPPHPPAAVVG